jgi:kynurenine/2-aminoadipate aminotransferase
LSAGHYQRFLSRRGQRLQPSAIRALQPFLSIPGMISLGGGMPNRATFPLDSLSFTSPLLPAGSEITVDSQALSAALQYSSSFGLPGLVDWLRAWQIRVHQPPLVRADAADSDLGICFFNGSQHALTVAFDILLNEGDAILVERPTYSGALAILRTVGADLKPVMTDGGGLVPASLREAVARTPSAKLLYVIPTGQNPSGASLSKQRKEEIYQIACEHDLLILEDDPYWNLQLNPEARQANASFLSMDREGRVLRFDSFSKVISAGLRLGFATGPPFLIEKMQLHQQASTLHPSGVAQGILLALLNRIGSDGLDRHIDRVQDFYRVQRDHMIAAVDRHLHGLVSYEPPQAGMFLWLESRHHPDTDELIRLQGPARKVLAVSGQSFQPDNAPSPFIRTSYSTATPADMDLACQRLAELLRPH